MIKVLEFIKDKLFPDLILGGSLGLKLQDIPLVGMSVNCFGNIEFKSLGVNDLDIMVKYNSITMDKLTTLELAAKDHDATYKRDPNRFDIDIKGTKVNVWCIPPNDYDNTPITTINGIKVQRFDRIIRYKRSYSRDKDIKFLRFYDFTNSLSTDDYDCLIAKLKLDGKFDS